METKTTFISEDGREFQSQEKCSEYEIYFNLFTRYIQNILASSSLLDDYDYYLNQDLTVERCCTHSDAMSCRPPSVTYSNVGHIDEIIVKNKSKIINSIQKLNNNNNKDWEIAKYKYDEKALELRIANDLVQDIKTK